MSGGTTDHKAATAHAVLITAYKDYPSLQRLVRRLDTAFFKLFIHIDKKSRIGAAEIAELQELGATVSKTHFIRWGTFSHLEAILDLIAMTVDEAACDYIHIVSGQEYPLWNAEEFAHRCDGRIFIAYGALRDQPEFVRDRYELGDPFRVLLRGRWGVRWLHKFLSRKTMWLRQLTATRRSRFGPYSSIYKALVWSSFPRSAAKRLLEDPDVKDFLLAIRETRVAEEIFFPTYFMNSDLAESVVKDDLRYTDWRERNGSNPAYLDETDTEAVLSSNALFARKMDSRCSARLLDAIDLVRFTG